MRRVDPGGCRSPLGAPTDGWRPAGSSGGTRWSRAPRRQSMREHRADGPSARGGGRNRVEDVPVLRAFAGVAVVLLFLEPLERPSLEEGARLGLREGGDVLIRRPRVAIAKELAREPTAGHDRAADPGPHVGEPGGVAEEQAEA